MTEIEPFIHRKVVVLDQECSVAQAALVMRERGIGSVLVADHQGHIVGIVTDRDLAIRVLAQGQGQVLSLVSVMSHPVISVNERADVEDVIRLMAEKGVRRVPVIEETHPGKGKGKTQRCIGLVSLDDLIASKLIDDDSLMRIVRTQVLRRMRPMVVHPLQRVDGEDELSAFFEMVSHQVSQSVELSRAEIEEVTEVILESIVQRLHHTGAMHLILQLPRILQEELIELPPGPDTAMTTARIVNELVHQYQMKESRAYLTLRAVCSALEQLIPVKELEHVKAQLPDDLRALFVQTGPLRF